MRLEISCVLVIVSAILASVTIAGPWAVYAPVLTAAALGASIASVLAIPAALRERRRALRILAIALICLSAVILYESLRRLV